MLPEFERQAKERSKANLRKGNKKPPTPLIKGLGESTDRAGKQFGTSGSSVQKAKRIKNPDRGIG
jgi:hypothetical protein